MIHLDLALLWTRIANNQPLFWMALWTTLYVAVIAQALGIFLGLGNALLARSPFLLMRAIATTYTLVIRGTPLIVQIFFLYYGANLLFGINVFPRTAEFYFFSLPGAVLAGITALGINEGAYMSEIIRAGIEAVDGGQMEAALSVGMSRAKAMRRIILPQATRVILPPLGNEFNNMINSTSLLSFIGVYELFQDAQVQYSTNFRPVEIFAGVAFWYLVLTAIWSLIQVRMERYLRYEGKMGVKGRKLQRMFGIQLGTHTR